MYFKRLEAETIKQADIKEIKRVYLTSKKKKNFSKPSSAAGISWAVTLVRYSSPFLKWELLQEMDLRTRNLMIISRGFYPRDIGDIRERLYVMWREELTSSKDSVESTDTRTQRQHKK